jgi:histone acetyltransferase (RNA polymerase elongator complex component)
VSFWQKYNVKEIINIEVEVKDEVKDEVKIKRLQRYPIENLSETFVFLCG